MARRFTDNRNAVVIVAYQQEPRMRMDLAAKSPKPTAAEDDVIAAARRRRRFDNDPQN